jgi:hypothetical protein
MDETAPVLDDISEMDWPSPPEVIPGWAIEEALAWRNLDDFGLLAKAEEVCGRSVELFQVPLPGSLWGLHVARGSRVRIYVNRCLPLIWKRFAFFHELYHLLHHKKGESFWTATATPMTSFEHQADMFAWAAILNDWSEGGEW